MRLVGNTMASVLSLLKLSVKVTRLVADSHPEGIVPLSWALDSVKETKEAGSEEGSCPVNGASIEKLVKAVRAGKVLGIATGDVKPET